MVEPLSFFVAPREGKALPVAPVSAKQLEEWAAETEMQAGTVRYHVGVGSFASDRDARSLAERFKVLGFAQAAATR